MRGRFCGKAAEEDFVEILAGCRTASMPSAGASPKWRTRRRLGGNAVTTAADASSPSAAGDASKSSVPWWKEPTKDQWLAWVAAWLGWTLDAFDFTMFLLIMVPILSNFMSRSPTSRSCCR
jgi:hypothetical protein